MILRRGSVIGSRGRVGGRARVRSGADEQTRSGQADSRDAARDTRAGAADGERATLAARRPAHPGRSAGRHLREPAGAAG